MSLRLCFNDNRLAHALVVMRLFSHGSILTLKSTVDRFRWTSSRSCQCCGPCKEESSEWCINQCERLVKSVAEQSDVYSSCRKCNQVCRIQQEQTCTCLCILFCVCYKIPSCVVHQRSLFPKHVPLRSALEA
jgi:hypothetical protein